MRHTLLQVWTFVTGMAIDTSFRIDIAEYYIEIGSRDSVVGIATTLLAERSRNQIPVLEKFSVPVQTGPGAKPVSYTMGTGSLSRR